MKRFLVFYRSDFRTTVKLILEKKFGFIVEESTDPNELISLEQRGIIIVKFDGTIDQLKVKLFDAAGLFYRVEPDSPN